MRFRLVPENRQFFDLIEKAGANMAAAALALSDLFSSDPPFVKQLDHVRDLEHEGDEVVHEIIRALNQTFVTPFDREDIVYLARRLDDVVDAIWAAASRVRIYEIRGITPIAAEFAKILVEQTGAINTALPRLRSRSQMKAIIGTTVEVNRLENEADRVLHEGLAATFSGTLDLEQVVSGIQWREIYGFLEQATDRAEDAADALESIVLKYG